MKKIPLFKPLLTNNDYKVIQNSLKTGWLTHGPKNLMFEMIHWKHICLCI